jgi:RNA recognition motif. (a.k.a. RRM, RBD, or RNP domain)/Restriction endonuclease
VYSPAPIAIGQRVTVAPSEVLQEKALQLAGILGAEHLAHAGVDAKVTSLTTVVRENNFYYFYTLNGSSLLWPHPALQLDSRSLTVNVARPMEERLPRGSSVLNRSHQLPSTYNPARLYIGNLSYDLRDIGLLRLLIQFGDIESLDIVMDKMTGRSKGFGFVLYRDPSAASAAAERLDKREVLSTGELLSDLSSPAYKQWLREGWHVLPSADADQGEEVSIADRIIAIVQDSSRRLAECVANYPDSLLHIEWRDFERMLASVFEALGFVVQCGPGSKDGGVDLTISTKSGTFSVQAKHWVSGKKVPGSVLKASVTVALNRGHGALVISTTGFSRNAATAITTVERRMLRVGERSQVHSLCRTYVSVAQGLFLPPEPDSILLANTRPI